MLPVAVSDEYLEADALLHLYSYELGNSEVKVPPPVRFSSPFGTKGFVGYLESLSNLLRSSRSVFGYWHKVSRVWRAGLESSALTLFVSIEGLVKTLYKELGKDPGFKNLCAKSLTHLSKFDADERVANRLKISLESSGGYNAKTALIKLGESQFIDKDCASHWSKLRNASAHADELNSNPDKLQCHVDLVFSNLRLFYDLIAWKAGRRQAHRLRISWVS